LSADESVHQDTGNQALVTRGAALWASYAALSVFLLFALYPILILLFNALKKKDEIGLNPLGPPSTFQFQNFALAWQLGRYTAAFTNSLIVTLLTIVGVVVISLLGAYSLARLKVPGGDALMMYLIVANTIPAQLFLVPLFYMWNQVGLVNNLFGVVLIYWARFAPFNIFLLRSFFVGLSRDFEDAARIDGASELQVLTHVVVPLSRPAVLTSALISGMWAWNEFLFAVIFLHDRGMQTVALRYVAFIGENTEDWALTSAAGVLVVIPIMVLFMFMQERFIHGMAAGGVKF
jgi:raffinose/stachyose/melibiose transport system permease protein